MSCVLVIVCQCHCEKN